MPDRSHEPDAEAGPYSEGLNPSLETGSTVYLQPIGESGRVHTVEVQPGVSTQEFTVNANSVDRDIEIRNLYQKDGVLAQYRFADDPVNTSAQIPTDVTVEVAQGGQQNPRFNNKNDRGAYSERTAGYGDGAPFTELWQWQDTDLHFTVTNNSGSQVTFEIEYIGWQYEIDTSADAGQYDATRAVPVERLGQR